MDYQMCASFPAAYPVDGEEGGLWQGTRGTYPFSGWEPSVGALQQRRRKSVCALIEMWVILHNLVYTKYLWLLAIFHSLAANVYSFLH